jgi:hypothetical protein
MGNLEHAARLLRQSRIGDQDRDEQSAGNRERSKSSHHLLLPHRDILRSRLAARSNG